MIDKVIFYDSDFISSFLLIDAVPFLKKVFSEIIIPDVVYDELTEHGTPNRIVTNINALVDENFVKIRSIDVFSPEYDKYMLIKEGFWHDNGKYLGNGESASLALVIVNNGVLASNNFSDIKFYVDRYKLPLLTSAFLLAFSVDCEIISKDEAVEMWDKMINEGVFLPKKTFLEYYSLVYDTDYGDFGHRLFDD